jgi:alpha-D-xyloside xylohydrolase
MTERMQFVDENPNAAYEIRVYTGADATFLLYEDRGNGYAYEQGKCALVSIEWDEHAQELIMRARKGSFPEMVEERACRILFISADGIRQRCLFYKGEEIRLFMDEVEPVES